MGKINDNLILSEDKLAFAAIVNKTEDTLKLVKALGLVAKESPKQPDKITLFLRSTLDSCRLVYNLGEKEVLKVLPIYTNYPFLIEGKYKPMNHQLLTAAFMALHNRCYVLSDCRLGKTGSAIMAMDWLQNTKAISGAALIITTLTTTKSVWYENIITSCPNKRTEIIHGKQGLDSLLGDYDFFITNYDTIRTYGKMFEQSVKAGKISYILVDELTHCGNPQALRTMAISKLINKTNVPYACGMTGTPGSNPEPVYGMCKTINPASFNYTTKAGWMSKTTRQYGFYASQWEALPEAPQLILEAMQPAIRFKKEEVLDLPPITHQIRRCNLTKIQTKAIESLWKDALLMLKTGDRIEAANAAIVLNKILQVAQGVVLDSKGQAVPLASEPRDQLILDTLQETTHKIVIFSMFRSRLKLLSKLFTDNNITNSLIHGDIQGDKRARVLEDFTKREDPRVLIAHPTTVGYGTELSIADTLIIDGPLLLGGFSYKQTLERLSSIKQQSSKINIIKIVGDIRELQLINRMDKDQVASQAVASLFEEERRKLYGK